MNDRLPSPPGVTPSSGPPSAPPAAPAQPGAHWPSVEALPVEPPTSHSPPLPPNPPSPGTIPAPWDPHGRLGEGGEPPRDDDEERRRRNRWYFASAGVGVVFLLLVALLFAYRSGQNNNETAASTTTSTSSSTTTSPSSSSTTASTTPPSTNPGDPPTSPPVTAKPITCDSASNPSIDEAKIKAEVSTISAFVEQARGLTFKTPPCVAVLDDQDFNNQIEAEIDGQRAVIEQQGNQLKALGIIPPDLDYVATLKKLKTEGVLGQYDPRTKQLIVRSGTDLGATERVTIAHELTHALQDQWFNLDRSDQYKDAKDEVVFGFRNVVEGDATRIEKLFVQTLAIPDQRQYQKDHSLVGNEDDQNGIPAGMRSALTDPYLFGEAFVAAVVASGGQPALDAVFVDPPKTSEQVMHPEKFLAGEAPIEVPIPAVPDGSKVSYDGMTGEYTTGQMLASANTKVTADNAAAGWGGDHQVVYTGDGKLCIRTDYAMDTPADFTDLQSAFANWQKKDAENRTVEAITPDRLRVTTCIPEPPPPPSNARNV